MHKFITLLIGMDIHERCGADKIDDPYSLDHSSVSRNSRQATRSAPDILLQTGTYPLTRIVATFLAV